MTAPSKHAAIVAAPTGRHREPDDRRWSAHRGATISGVLSDMYLPKVTSPWQVMVLAPRDGSPILASIGGNLVPIQWAEDHASLVGDVPPGAGTNTDRWVDASGLPVDEPEAWRPLPVHVPAGDAR